MDASSQTAGQKYKIRIKNFDLVYDKVTLSVPNIALASALRVFPNPVKAGETDVYLQIEEPAEISVQVYDLNGKLLEKLREMRKRNHSHTHFEPATRQLSAKHQQRR